MTTTTSSDLDDVRGKLTELAASGRVDELIELVITLLGSAQSSNTALTSRLQNALRALYGRKSEKFSADQLSLLFAELGDEAPETARKIAEAPGDVPQPDKPPPAARAKRGRFTLPTTLPREIHDVRVPDTERACDRCGAEKKAIGFLASEILEFVPAHFKIIEERREKLACEACGDGVVIADSEKVMDGGRPGPALLAHIVVSKFQDSLPLYRQCQIYERAGVSIAQSTIGDWTGLRDRSSRAHRDAHHRSRPELLRDWRGRHRPSRSRPRGSARREEGAYLGLRRRLQARRVRLHEGLEGRRTGKVPSAVPRLHAGRRLRRIRSRAEA